MLAKYNGTCPICGKFIKKNLSRVEALRVEVQPLWAYADCDCIGDPCNKDRPHTRKYLSMGDRYYTTSEVAPKARKWVHERCAGKENKTT